MPLGQEIERNNLSPSPRRQQSQFGYLLLQVYLKDLLKHAAIDLRSEDLVRRVIELLEMQMVVKPEHP